ncbi:thioredoxin fold domain-containing protein [Flavilitoribacter nigricans]|uniref:Thioredoxin domain-containing protein n=1 Tax=Flavilitoribacter nigricans (strain ATCC 23147 / DSM 23189 / NBRC 102662 / NCIMB 1420 / SS-2) TaxID=1122177 RepID=A0A2D0N6H6_FLAN2|nr:thioredoxin family protein [Flavilitoribacter nigricans]PHN04067.1 hypothetical protein CRP01_22995 [Flavilitoribacter nigricans DSM 23189 = NBRC 102662]
MKHYCTLLWLCLIHWLVPGNGQPAIPFLNKDLNEVREIAGQQGSLYFAFFTANWCAPCHWMEEQAFTSAPLISYVRQHYLAVKVDIDERGNRPHQERFQVKLLPSILVFNAQGQLLAKIETALSGEDLLKILEEHNLPKNRIGSTRHSFASEEIMDSPKPSIKLYRPPLPSENNGNNPPPPTELPPPVMVPGRTTQQQDRNTPSQAVPVARPNTRETFAPRSEKTYSIQVASYEDYQQAIRQVAQLESGVNESVRLLGGKDDAGKQVFRIFIGMFPDRKKAEDYLFYLRRKNVSGVIQDMMDVR